MNIGVTGHQNLISNKVKKWVQKLLSEYLSKYDDIVGFSCLAEGADQVFAEEILKKGFNLVAIIPSHNYEKSFSSKSARINFNDLLLKSSNIINLSFKNPSEEAYWEAGKTIVDSSDLVLAIWNGKEAEGLGGTGDIVKYAISKGKTILHFDISKKSIKKII